jgi:hypothetical protein
VGAGLPGCDGGAPASGIRLKYHAAKVYVVAGGTGTLTVDRDGKTSMVTISGPPNLHEIASSDEAGPGQLDLVASKGLQVFSFTYG